MENINAATLKGLAAEVHEIAVTHGWWDEPREFGEIIALIHSELSEALEEYRNGRPLVYFPCNNGGVCVEEGRENMTCDSKTGNCKSKKPEGIAVELADTVIRILDWFGQDEATFEELQDANEFEWPSFGCFIADCHEVVSISYTSEESKPERTFYLRACISAIFVYLKKQGIDPLTVIRLKMDYNKNRPYRHGGKKC